MCMIKLYLDNCCYNRPFDDQTQLKIQLETQAKLQIQNDIKCGKYKLVWSYIMEYENSKNPFNEKRESILKWKNIASESVLENKNIIEFAETLSLQGLKTYDALHISCAVEAGCDYFITTDRRLLNLQIENIKIVDPIKFVIDMEEIVDD